MRPPFTCLRKLSLENILNELPDAEADRLCHAKRYERNAERASTRAGSYKRNFETTSGKVTLNIPRLRNLPFETAIIERNGLRWRGGSNGIAGSAAPSLYAHAHLGRKLQDTQVFPEDARIRPHETHTQLCRLCPLCPVPGLRTGQRGSILVRFFGHQNFYLTIKKCFFAIQFLLMQSILFCISYSFLLKCK